MTLPAPLQAPVRSEGKLTTNISMSSANPDFHNASSTHDVHAAANFEKSFGEGYLGKVWHYLATISGQSNYSIVSFFVWLAHNNKFMVARPTLTSTYSQCRSCSFSRYCISPYVLPALFIDHATSDPLTDLKALWL